MVILSKIYIHKMLLLNNFLCLDCIIHILILLYLSFQDLVSVDEHADLKSKWVWSVSMIIYLSTYATEDWLLKSDTVEKTRRLVFLWNG